MKNLSCIIATIILSAAASTLHAQGYKIIGTAKGLPDGTKLYLRTARPDKDIDSCTVMNNRFDMIGRIKEKAAPVYLHTSRYTNYVHFWLENTNINISVKAGEFKKGTISGSVTQNEDKSLELLSNPIDASIDSLNVGLESTVDKDLRKETISKISLLRGKRQTININWVKDHPNSLVAANLLNIYSSTWGKKITTGLYHNLSLEVRSSQYGKEINDFIILNKKIQLGKKYADFEQANALGELIKLSEIKGKYILLDFWASWCGPCREENPNLVKTYDQFKNKGFTILGVSLDDNKSNWLKAIKDDQLTWENVCDLRGDKNKAALIYGVSGIPDNFLIDDKGIIIAKNLRGQKLDDKLKQLFAVTTLP